MTEFGRYLKQCPPALKDKTRTLSLLKDALKNDLPKFRVLQAAYELGILEAIQRSNPISTDDRLKITTGLVSQYAMLENAAKNAISFGQPVGRAARFADRKWTLVECAYLCSGRNG